ncbi:MAG: DHH family phosphoesterase [Lachnospiraceae bacterium]|nr:DHH family phosphoesterase [Lachnospiraceae bacterium]
METTKKNALKALFIWPLAIGILFAALTAAAFFVDTKAGFAALILTALYLVLLLAFYLVLRKRIVRKLSEFGSAYSQVQNRMLRRILIPFALTDSKGNVYWANDAFRSEFNIKKNQETAMQAIFPDLKFLEGNDFHLEREGKFYRVDKTDLTSDVSTPEDLKTDPSKSLFMVYVKDETDAVVSKRTLEDERAVLALVYLDNYDEIMDGVEYEQQSILAALLERKLSKYVANYKSVIRKMEKDRYFFVAPHKAIVQMEADKFPILDDIKTVNVGGQQNTVTVSMGIGMGGETFAQNYAYAENAIDMALGRGGDQVVFKNGEEVRYFGGKTRSTERNTRVKARMKANALREIIEAKESVLIMGHPISDLDCLGAAMGIYSVANYSGKKANIVLDQVTSTVEVVADSFRKNSDYPSDLFVTPQQAIDICAKDTLIVVVDTNRPSYTVCPELLNMTDQVVVMDHHRQGKEYIENALLSYVEPYASSASEMVAEVVQYYADNLRLKPAEADAVYAGIVMDTGNFESKAGVRTFEAAAYLRRCGADVTRVRKLFRDTREDYRLRTEILSKAQVYKEHFIIGICPKDSDNPDLTVIAAQAANELLRIRGVKASFVFTEYDKKIFLSARSIDEMNVQVVCEKLGGGGHMSIAGAQFTDCTVEEAVERLKAVLEEE